MKKVLSLLIAALFFIGVNPLMACDCDAPVNNLSMTLTATQVTFGANKAYSSNCGSYGLEVELKLVGQAFNGTTNLYISNAGYIAGAGAIPLNPVTISLASIYSTLGPGEVKWRVTQRHPTFTCGQWTQSAQTFFSCTGAAAGPITAGGPLTFCQGGSVVLTSAAGSVYQWFRNNSLIAGATSQNYTATTSGAYSVSNVVNGCPSPVVNVTAQVPPTTSVSATATTIPFGGSTTLTGTFQSTRIYLVPVADLLNMPSNGCNTVSFYGNNNQGIRWTDIGAGNVSNVTIEFSVGVECHNGKTFTTILNGAAGPTYGQTVSFCDCSLPPSERIVTLNFPNPSIYNIGGVNTFNITNSTTAMGMAPAASLGNVYARVTVTYGSPAGTTFAWNPGNLTTNPITVSPASTTTYNLTTNNGICSTSVPITITVLPPPVTFTLTSTDESCVEAGDGSITVNVTGGSGTIEYSLNNAPFVLTNVFTGLTASNYQVRIKNGAFISAPQNIVVVTTPDTQIPVISCPSNISVIATSASGTVVTYTTPVGTDNCPGATTARTAGLASGSTFPIGVTTVTHRVTDAAGLTAECSFTVTVSGLAPVIVCPSNITVNNAVGQCGATVSFAATESTAIPASTITYSHAPGSLFPVGTTTVTATATNAVGVSSCTFTVTVTDTEFPVIANCPGTITANAAPGQCSAPVSFTLPPLAPTVDQQITDIFIGTAGTDQWQSFTAGRNGLLTQVDLYRNGIQPFNGTLTIYQGVGVSGTSIYSSTYNYPDDNNWTSLPLVPANQPTVTAGQTYTIRIQSPVGAFGVGLMLLGGNPSNQGTYFSNSYGLNPGWKLNFRTYVATASPSISATDNCSVTSFTSTHNSGDVFPVGTTPVTFSAVDAAGNATTCSFNVVVVDNQAPTITCPININLIATSAAGRAVNYTAPIGTDNCSGVSTALTAGLASGSTFPIGTSTVTYTATDAAGLSTSCSFTVTVTGLAPAITCPANITVNNTQGQCGANVSFAATETQAIPASTITYSHQPGSFFPVGTTTVTATANNAIGTSSCSFTVTVNDTENPTITCNAPIVVSNDEGQCGAIVMYTVTSGDNCPGQTVAQTTGLASGSVFPVGVTTNTFVVTDASGNTATCSFTVTVNDNQSPTIACPANITVSTGPGNTSCSQTATWTSPTASDNCGTVTVTSTHNPGSVFPVGTTTVTYTVIDAANNQSTCSFTVTVIDNTPPIVTCPAAITVSTSPNQCGAAVTYSQPTVTDNCNQVNSGVHTLNSGAQFFDYANNVFETQNSPGLPISFFPTDGQKMAVFLQNCGSTHFMYQNVTLPASGSINLSFDLKYTNHFSSFSTNQFIAVQLRNPTTNALITTLFQTTASSPLSTPMTSYTYNLSAYAGQQVRLQIVDATINNFFLDVLLDNIKIPGSSLVNGSFETGNYSGWAIGSSTGVCGTFGIGSGPSTVVVQTAGLPSGSVFPVGLTTNSFLATDASGNTATCSFTVSVTDNETPAINCPSPIVVSNDEGQCGALVTYTVTSTDNCPGQTIAQTAGLPSGSTFPVGTTTNTFTATDAAGNLSTCSFAVTVVDNENPTINCPADIILCGSQVVNYNMPTATDNCSFVITQTSGLPSGSVFPVGTTLNTFTVTDPSNNSVSCSFNVTINPVPTVNVITSQTVCNNGATATVNFTGTVPGTVYNWTNSTTSIGLAASGTGNIASFTALNPTNAPVTATITVTPQFTNGGLTCTGQSLSFTIRVNPTAIVNPVANKVVCFGAAPGGTILSSPTTGGPIVYTWTNNTPAVGLAASGIGNIPNFIAKNTTNTPLVATITVTPSFGTAGNCSGTATTFTITVNPTPNFDNAQYFSGILSASDPVYARPEQYNQGGTCSVSVDPSAGSSVHYRTHTFTLAEPSNVVVSLLNSDGGLVVPAGNNINIDPFLQLVGPGGFNPLSSCTNSIAANDDAGFLPQGRLSRIATTTPLAAGTYTVVVTTWENTPGVNALNDLVLPWDYTLAVLTTSQTVCNNSATTALNFNTTVPGTVFNWTNNNTSIGIAANGSGSIPSFTATNTSLNPVTATIIVTPSYSNAGVTCTGAPVRYYINVNPTPTITCPGDQTATNIEGICSAVVNYSNTATGTPTPAISYTFTGATTGSGSGNGSGSSFNVGVTTVTLTATNECGVPSCSFTVTVNDTENPTITCNAPIEVSNDEGLCGAIVNYAVTSTDNCPGQTVAQTTGLPSGSVFPLGVTTNTFVVTDASGNVATCIFTVTVNDTEDPTISCNAPIVVGNDEGQCGAIVTYAVTSGDNCPGQTVAQTAGLPSGSFFPKGTTTNTFVVTDASGNTSTCSFTVTVNDNQNPVITCPGAIVRNNDANQCGAVVTYTIGSSDNCPGQTVAQTAGLPSGSFFPKGTTTNTFVVTDASGNTATCSFTVTVNDNQNPVITCPASAIRLTNSGLCTYKVQNTEFNATATDNCGVTSLTYTLSGATSGSGTSFTDVLLNRGTTTVTWTAIDAANNPISCSFNVVVNDDQNATNFMIYAEREVNFDEYHYIGGDVGVTDVKGKADFKKNSVLDPYRITAKNINVQTPSAVNNRTFSPATGGPNPTFFAYNGNTTGLSNITVSTNTTLNGNWKDVTVKKGITATITGNNFGKISIEEGAVVTFTASVINLQELKIEKGKKNTNVLTIVNFANPASVKVKDKVTIEDDSRVNVGGPKVTFYAGDNTGGDEKFEVKGENSQVTANIMVPVGKLHVHGGNDISRPIIMTGWYIIEKLDGHGKYVYWNKYDCSNPAPPMQFVNKVEEIKTPVVIVSAPVEPKVSKELFKANVYPNPSAVEFTLQVISSSNEPIWVRIIDMNGVVRSVNKVASKTNIIKVGASLASGTYIAEVSQGENKQAIKLVKLN